MAILSRDRSAGIPMRSLCRFDWTEQRKMQGQEVCQKNLCPLTLGKSLANFPQMAHACMHPAGHSMGGALATLAGYDIAAAAAEAGLRVDISCYTFGAPRTGNHAFARDFERMVPDTWGLINDQVGTG